MWSRNFKCFSIKRYGLDTIADRAAFLYTLQTLFARGIIFYLLVTKYLTWKLFFNDVCDSSFRDHAIILQIQKCYNHGLFIIIASQGFLISYFPDRLADQKPLASEDWEVIYNHCVLISPKVTRLLLQYIKA